MISIGIASYNQQEFLPDAIESALNQSWPCPVLVCNDGSTDNSLEIAQKYPVKVINQPNKGLASTRNTLLMNMDNPWVLFLDADDVLLEGCIEKICEQIKIHPEADIISPSFKTFGISNEPVILSKDPKLEDFRVGNRIPYCSAIRRSKLLEVGGYSPRMVEGYEDLHLTMVLLERGAKIVTIPEVLWLYRTKEKSMWRNITPETHKKLLAQINKDVVSANLNF